MRIFTIGYEGATVGEFLAALQDAGVERVIDVRALPLSRRPGFSKSPLGAALEEAGIDYVHLKALGTPPMAERRRGQGGMPTWRGSSGSAGIARGDGAVARRCSSSPKRNRVRCSAIEREPAALPSLACCSTPSQRAPRWCDLCLTL